MNTERQYSFWGHLSPLGGLSGAGLLIMASARLSWAVTIAGSLLWVYGLSALVFSFMTSKAGEVKFLPSGTPQLFAVLSSFFGTIYLLMVWLLCPFAAFEVLFPLLLVPLFCASSGVYERIASSPENSRVDIFDHVSETVSQAAVLAGLVIILSIVREPLAYCSLSLPGTTHGMVTIMYFNSGSFFPIGIFAVSAGAMLLLGYFIALYQYAKSVLSGGY